MQIEIRADGAHITGYVNVTEKKSRPVITPRGKVVEVIEPRAFERALQRARNIPLTVDHDSAHVYASTEDRSLTLHEDSIGLHADVLIRDSVPSASHVADDELSRKLSQLTPGQKKAAIDILNAYTDNIPYITK